MTFALSVFAFLSHPSHPLLFIVISLFQLGYSTKPELKSFAVFVRKHFNTSNRSLSVWKSHPNLSSSRERHEALWKLFQLQHWLLLPIWFKMLNDSLIASRLMWLCLSDLYVWGTNLLKSHAELCERGMWRGSSICGGEMCIEEAPANKLKNLFCAAFVQYSCRIDWVPAHTVNIKPHTAHRSV